MDEETELQRLNNSPVVIQGESASLEPGLIPQCVLLPGHCTNKCLPACPKAWMEMKGICIFIEWQEVIMMGA